MMHPHSMHQHHQGHQGPPPQHLSHAHHAMTHHQIPPPPHHGHRDQNRLLSGGGQGGGSGMSLGMGGMGPNTPRPILSAMPPPPPAIVHHHRPPPPPRHLMAHPPAPPSMPPPTIHQRPDRHERGQMYNNHSTGPNKCIQQNSGVLLNVGQSPTPNENESQSTIPNLVQPPNVPNSVTLIDAAKLLPPSNTNTTITILSSDPGISANSKEKTPMCLINELARFNKIQHQYRLVSEQGPAHRKRFTVSLRLGGEIDPGTGEPVNGEEYSAEGYRIRLAQHAVAAEALRLTHYPSPPPRPPRTRSKRTDSLTTIMPTVELNALTMKLGLTAVYTQEAPILANTPRSDSLPFRSGVISIRPPALPVHPMQFNRNPRMYQRFPNHFGKYPVNPYKEQYVYSTNMHTVRLMVGTHIFKGEGVTPQAARHDAASKALKELRDSKEEETCDENEGPGDDDDDDTCDVKSPVSMVHEIALKFNLPVNFEVKSEKGPPHMKVFLTICTVAEHVTEGEGNSKKVSKKRAAEKMLRELKKLPSVKKTVIQPDPKKPKKKPLQPKKRSRSLIKEKTDSIAGPETNPVSRLLQWATSSEGGTQEPVYTLEEEVRGSWKERPHFCMKCEVAGQQSKGTGASKKIAKRAAAEAMLITLGLGKTASPSKSTSKNDLSSETGKNGRKTPFGNEKPNANETTISSSNVGGSSGRQLVPGLLLMQDHNLNPGTHFTTPNKNGINAQTTATIAKELLNAGTSPTADALAKLEQNRLGTGSQPISSSVVSSTTGNNLGKMSQTNQVIRPKDQLLYLAQLLGFEVQFSDFKKGSHGELLSLVSLSTEPPMVCHGGGLSIEQSHDQSAREALERLAQMGLDNVTPHTTSSSQNRPNNEGIYVNGNDKPVSGLITNGINNNN